MRGILIMSGAALAASLTGCEDAPPPPANNVATSANEVANQIAALPEGQRNGVFIRAIRDAGQECQHVESSDRAGEHRGYPVWNATCSGGGTWTIVITNNGIAQVLNAAEARLVEDVNQAVNQHEGQ